MQVSSHPFVQSFIQKPSTEAYIDELCMTLKSLNIGGPIKRETSKRNLIKLLDKSESATEEQQIPECLKN